MDLSIIIPSYNERGNVQNIVDRIEQSMAETQIAYDIWFVDDSTDDTVVILEQLSNRNRRVHVHHRDGKSGLASAVVAGFERSQGRFLVVMDADLQHPPELLPEIYERLLSGVDVVIPSRFVSGGSDGGLGPIRKVVSWTARVIGQAALQRLRKISDCTSGFFGLRRQVLDSVQLDPIGWKILIEVLVKGRYKSVHEMPYRFSARGAGESKMSLKEQWNYFRHIFRLVVQSPRDRRFWLFCVVGASGVILNEIVLGILKYGAGVKDTEASILASFVAMLSNYIWNDQWTWRKSSDGRRWSVKFPLFALISATGIAVTTLVMTLFKSFGTPVLIGQVLGIVVATLWTFSMNNRFTWKAQKDVRENDKVVVTRDEVKMRSV